MHLQRMAPGTVARDGDFETSPYNPNVSEYRVVYLEQLNSRTDMLCGLVSATPGLAYPRAGCSNILYRPVTRSPREIPYEPGYDYFLPSSASNYVVAAGDECTDAGPNRWRLTNRNAGSEGNTVRIYRRRVASIVTTAAGTTATTTTTTTTAGPALPSAAIAVLKTLRKDVMGLMGDGHSDEQIGHRVLRTLDSLLVGNSAP